MDTRLLMGTIELLVLDVASRGATYGYEISQVVTNRSRGRFELKEGSLYPALHRLERQKLVRSFWQEFDGRRRKYYELTAAGRKALDSKRSEWTEFSTGVNGVLGASYGLA